MALNWNVGALGILDLFVFKQTKKSNRFTVNHCITLIVLGDKSVGDSSMNLQQSNKNRFKKNVNDIKRSKNINTARAAGLEFNPAVCLAYHLPVLL